MESYDIIANQPVVIDNVRPGSWGEDGRPALGGARGGAGRGSSPVSTSPTCTARPPRPPGALLLSWLCSPGPGANPSSAAELLGPGGEVLETQGPISLAALDQHRECSNDSPSAQPCPRVSGLRTHSGPFLVGGGRSLVRFQRQTL